MKSSVRLAAVIAVLSTGAAVQASSNFKFSYKFDDRTVLSGSFSGNRASENIISNIFNVLADYEGFSLEVNKYSSTNRVEGAAVISVNGLQNDFYFYNSGTGSHKDDLFSSDSTFVYSKALFLNSTRKPVDSAYWTVLPVVDVSDPVVQIPEPEIVTLMLAGLGALALATRRRKAESSSN